ncbi:MAG TPA: hypothetical protein VIG88_12970 [Lysobacter sp.]
MHRTIIAAALLLAASTAPAQTVYRCAVKGKPVSFQNEPCAGAPATRIIDYVPDREAPPEVRRAAIQREMDARHAAQRARAAHVFTQSRPSSESTSCWQAKQARDAWERMNPLNRSVEISRYWQDYVFRHCR